MDTTTPTWDPDHPLRRDVTACRSLLAGTYSRLPRTIIEEAQR